MTTTWARLRNRINTCEQVSAVQPDEHGFRASANVRQLQKLRRAIEDEIDREIIRAREQGMQWVSIDYGSSKQAAQQRHAAAVRRAK